jgi:hypothetical protein
MEACMSDRVELNNEVAVYRYIKARGVASKARINLGCGKDWATTRDICEKLKKRYPEVEELEA